MFIKSVDGYVNTDKLHFFSIRPDNELTEYGVFGVIDWKEQFLIKRFDTEEEAEKHLKKLIEKINAE